MTNTTKAGIRCGSCHNRHQTVAQVRLCYENKAREQHEARMAEEETAAEQRSEQWWEERGGPVDDPIERDKWAMEDLARETRAIQQREREDDERAYKAKAERDEALEAAARLDAMTGAPGRDMASDKQVRYIMDLLRDKVWPDPLSEEDVRNLERRQATKLIDNLKSSPTKGKGESPIPEVPAGRYALVMESGDDAMSYSAVDRQDLVKPKERRVDFFQVDRPTEGRWAGRTFLKRLIGAPGDYRKEPVRGMAAARILQMIAADPEEASLLYGKESGVCGVCSSPLTNAESLKRGIGPVCASKSGWGA